MSGEPVLPSKPIAGYAALPSLLMPIDSALFEPEVFAGLVSALHAIPSDAHGQLMIAGSRRGIETLVALRTASGHFALAGGLGWRPGGKVEPRIYGLITF